MRLLKMRGSSSSSCPRCFPTPTSRTRTAAVAARAVTDTGVAEGSGAPDNDSKERFGSIRTPTWIMVRVIAAITSCTNFESFVMIAAGFCKEAVEKGLTFRRG